MKKPPGNLAGRRGLLDEVHGEREEVDSLARLGAGGGDEHDGFAVADQRGACGLLGQAAGLDGHRAIAGLE